LRAGRDPHRDQDYPAVFPGSAFYHPALMLPLPATLGISSHPSGSTAAQVAPS
jgi:hypothetical protein